MVVTQESMNRLSIKKAVSFLSNGFNDIIKINYDLVMM